MTPLIRQQKVHREWLRLAGGDLRVVETAIGQAIETATRAQRVPTGEDVQYAIERMVRSRRAQPHRHRRPRKDDFEGKTIQRFQRSADNIWRLWFTDGTAFAIQAEIEGIYGVPFMEVCEACVSA